MNLRRSVIGRGKGTLLIAAAVSAAGIGLAAAVPAYATSDDPAGESPVSQDQVQRHEQIMKENPGMTRMHELMMEENPGMARMHEGMMERGSGHHGEK